MVRSVSRNVYTAPELREHDRRAFERAHERFARMVYADPTWASEHRESLAAALAAIGGDLPRIDGPTRAHDVRRCMAWLENNVLAPLRLPFVPISSPTAAGDRRRRTSKYGESYRPGCVDPCPWTWYYVDDALIIGALRDAARRGVSPHEWPRLLRDEADRLWEAEVDDQASERAFLERCEVDGREFYEDGTEV